ncbi:carbohydrate porin [Dyella monticola]|uniref:carbohydrate porin n=1 Tax=Dyella monticola TaxID=1927958 RepID=UPI001314B2DA|nr:carbohydrate porin [Dyella monticola]
MSVLRKHASQLALTAIALAIAPALAAQTSDDASASVATHNDGTSPPKPGALNGISPVLDFVGNGAANPVGGVHSGYKKSGWIKFGATFDFDTLFGWKGMSMDVYAAWFGGGNLARSDIGNSISAQQTWRPVAGGRLTQFDINKKFDNGFSFTVGRIALNTYFNRSPLDCDFMSNAMCLTPYGPISDIGITAYPNSSWGAVTRYDFQHFWYVQSGAFDYDNVENLAHRNGLDFDLGHNSIGVLQATEIGNEVPDGLQTMPHAYRFGIYHNTNGGTSPYFDDEGTSAALAHRPLEALPGGRTAWYGMVDQTVWRGEDGRRLQLLARGFANTGNPQVVKQFGAVGASLTGTFPGRDRDTLNMFISDTRFESQEIDYLADLRHLAGGVGAPHRNEYISELDYGIAAFRGVRIMPDLQYIVNPDPIYATKRKTDIPNALVVGLRVDIHVAQMLGW